MAPKRQRTKAAETEQAPKRVTRSSARLNGAQSELVVTKTSPIKKKAPVKVKKTSAKTVVEEVKVKKTSAKTVVEEVKVSDDSKSKTIVIEHCKQCNSFKTRAFQVKDGLEKGVTGVTVIVNPEKPRRGCFEIRDEEGKKFISLLDMKRPFTAMKGLDMDNVIADIVENIK